MTAGSMDMGMTDLSVEAGRDGPGMEHSATDTADLELIEWEH